jgi:O-antigen/teichoic acid export membrane protein
MSNYSTQAFRRSIVQYTGGRVANALAAFTVFVWIARYLPEQHYANYIAAYACLELALVIFGFGMEWVTAVFVPQFRLKANGQQLSRFVWSCAGVQMAQLLLGACSLLLLAPFLSEWLHLKDATDIFRLYALVMCVEGLSRVVRDQLLSCLLLQGAAQISQMARNLIMLAFALMLTDHEQWRSASALAVAELCASGLSLVLAATLLYRYLREMRSAPSSDPQWTPPLWRSLFRAGRHAWLSNLVNLSWGGQAIILLVTRVIGPEATAALGFARNLSEQIRRYMPMEFLMGIMRTLLLARFYQDKNARLLGIKAGLMYRANLLFLLPFMALTIVRGGELCALLSNDRYAEAQWYLVGWLVVLVFWAHHRLSDLLAHAMQRADLTSRSSLKLIATPALLALAAYFHAWPVLFMALAAAELSYSLLVLAPLAVYRPNWSGIAKLLGATLAVWAVLALPAWAPGMLSLSIQTALAFILIPSLAALSQAWTAEEAALVFPGKAIETAP